MGRSNKNKRLEITLTLDEMTLLESLSVRFNISKSSVIKQALKVFASKRKHYLTLSYREVNVSEEPNKGAVIREKEDNKNDTELKKKWDKLFDDEFNQKFPNKINPFEP